MKSSNIYGINNQSRHFIISNNNKILKLNNKMKPSPQSSLLLLEGKRSDSQWPQRSKIMEVEASGPTPPKRKIPSFRQHRRLKPLQEPVLEKLHPYEDPFHEEFEFQGQLQQHKLEALRQHFLALSYCPIEIRLCKDGPIVWREDGAHPPPIFEERPTISEEALRSLGCYKKKSRMINCNHKSPHKRQCTIWRKSWSSLIIFPPSLKMKRHRFIHPDQWCTLCRRSLC